MSNAADSNKKQTGFRLPQSTIDGLDFLAEALSSPGVPLNRTLVIQRLVAEAEARVRAERKAAPKKPRS